MGQDNGDTSTLPGDGGEGREFKTPSPKPHSRTKPAVIEDKSLQALLEARKKSLENSGTTKV
ncbi:hypothetical protein SK128_018795, partial [Halocaridina rubra]